MLLGPRLEGLDLLLVLETLRVKRVQVCVTLDNLVVKRLQHLVALRDLAMDLSQHLVSPVDLLLRAEDQEADTGDDECAHRFGQLDRGHADTARCAIDQHQVPRANLANHLQRMVGGEEVTTQVREL